MMRDLLEIQIGTVSYKNEFNTPHRREMHQKQLLISN